MSTRQPIDALWPADAVVRWPLARLVPAARNARQHSAQQIDQLARSIEEWGWTIPVLIDEGGTIIAGHGRVLAAQKLGIAEVPVMIARGWSDAKKRAYVIADNKLALNASWDDAMLKAELADLRLEGADLATMGFDAAELRSLLEAANPLDGQGEPDPQDELPPTPRRVVSRPGDLWCIGQHRLLCGDSTQAESQLRVLGGNRAALLFTSPPYGDQRAYTTDGISDWDALMRGVFQHLDQVMQPAGQVLVNLGLIHREGEWQPYWQGWIEWMRERGWRRFGLYAWDQGPGLPGDWNGRLSPAFELLFHFNREPRRPNKIIPCTWAGHIAPGKGGLRARDGTVGEWQHAGKGVQDMRIPDSVVRITRHKVRGIETEHPAVSPILLWDFILQAYTDPGEWLLEPFSGAGTSMLAGERTGRPVAGIELAPVYVDLTIARFAEIHPGVPVTLEGDGRSFAEVAAARPAEEAA